MTNQLIQTNNNQIAPFAPQTFKEWWDMAALIVKAGLAPKGMETTEKCFLALQRGAQLGFFPLQAIDEISVIHGRPYVSTQAHLGQVQSSGLLEDKIEEFIEEDGKITGARCILKRKGMKTPVTRTFTLADAKAGGLLEKDNWKKDPIGMLQTRALRKSLSAGFADVLRGMGYSAEEARDMDMVDVTPKEASMNPAPPASTIEHYEEPPAEVHIPTVLLCGTGKILSRVVPVNQLFDEIKKEQEAITSAESFANYKDWSSANHHIVKEVLPKDKLKALSDGYFSKMEIYEPKPIAASQAAA